MECIIAIAPLFTAIAAIAACFAAFTSRKSVKIALKTLRIQAISNLMEERFSEDIYNSKITLRDFQKGCESYDQIKKKYVKEKDEKIDKSRRLFFNYFRKVKDLIEAGLINVKDIKHLVNESDAEMLYSISRPIEEVVFRDLQKKMGKGDRFSDDIFRYFAGLFDIVL